MNYESVKLLGSSYIEFKIITFCWKQHLAVLELMKSPVKLVISSSELSYDFWLVAT